jgi:hypothetical protein
MATDDDYRPLPSSSTTNYQTSGCPTFAADPRGRHGDAVFAERGGWDKADLLAARRIPPSFSILGGGR